MRRLGAGWGGEVEGGKELGGGLGGGVGYEEAMFKRAECLL